MEKIGKIADMDPNDVWDQVKEQAERKGIIRPQPGKHFATDIISRVARRYAKLLKRVWVVRDPSKSSEWGDIIFDEDPINLSEIVIGMGSAAWRREHTAMHDDLRSAEADAWNRLKKFWGGNIPDWVFENTRPRTIRI